MVYSLPGHQDFAEVGAIITEMAQGSDRSVAIVGGALVEETLQTRMVRSLHADEKLERELFHPSGPFAAFGTKIRLAQLIGFVSAEFARELHLISRIRNRFAHNLSVRTFDDPATADLCRELRFCEILSVDNRKPEPKGDGSHGWIGVFDRDDALKTARGRFVISIQTALYGLAISEKPKPAAPKI